MTTHQHPSPSSPKASCTKQQHPATIAVQWCMHPYVRVGLLILVWFTLGIILSFYNKLLLGKSSAIFLPPFPAPLFMSGIQFAMQHVMAQLLFGSGLMQRSVDKLSWQEWSRSVVPNGCCTGMDIGLSNMSLVFITISFYTMCKATVPLFLLLFAFIFQIEKPSWLLGLVVFIISCGLALLVSGEVQFDMAGFSLVMVAACLSGLRFTLTQIFLHGNHGTAALGSPLEFLEALTPVMSATVLALSLFWEQLWIVLPASPFFESFYRTSLTICLIFLGAIIAFLLVWTEYKVIRETSALTFTIAGSCKEVLTVIAAVLFFDDPFGILNMAGLAIVLLGVGLFKFHKIKKLNQKSEVMMTVISNGEEKEIDMDADFDGDDRSAANLEMQPLIRSQSRQAKD